VLSEVPVLERSPPLVYSMHIYTISSALYFENIYNRTSHSASILNRVFIIYGRDIEQCGLNCVEVCSRGR